MLRIKVADLSDPEIHALLQEHLDYMFEITPSAESVYALDLEALKQENITFWSGWLEEALVGCIALKDHGSGLGEIKSMHTRAKMRGQGVAKTLVSHLIESASSRGMKRLSLETGNSEGFVPAQKLYASFGFEPTEPFADYEADPHSFFMTKVI